MAIPNMIKDIIGKDVKITTLTVVHKGRVVDIQDDWIKIILKGDNEYFVKEDMITGITILK